MEDSFELDNYSHIGAEYREIIIKIMNKCSVDAQEAYENLIMNDFDIEKTIKQLRKHNNGSKPQHKNNKIKYVSRAKVSNEIFIEQDIEADSDEQYQHYYYFQHSTDRRKYFYQKYPIDIQLITKKHQARNYHENVRDTLFDKLNNLTDLSSNLPRNQVSSLQEAFCCSYQNKMPVLILITDLRQQIQQKVRELFQNTPDIKYRMCSQFIYFGIYKNSYKVQKWLQKYIKLQDNMNMIVVGRVNLYDEIQIVSKFSLLQNISELLISLKRIKSNCIQLTLDDKYMRLKHKMFQQGKYWRRPTTFKQRSKKKREQRKILSDQKLRRQQEQMYKVIERIAVNQDQKLSKKEDDPQRNKQNILKMREQKRKNLKDYDQGVRFKIRVPSGSNLFLTIPKEAKIQYLFDFIQCREQQLGFQDELIRKFDIFIGYGQTNSLDGKQQTLVGSQFQDSVFLVVRQLFQ